MKIVISILILFTAISHVCAQEKPDDLLGEIFDTNKDTLFNKVVSDPSKYRLQIIYTQIDRDRKNRLKFTNHFFHYDPKLYFNPASMVKMPLAFLSLEKLHSFHKHGINKFSTILFDSSQPWHRSMHTDSTSETGLPSIAQFIRRSFLISENDPYNRMYQFMGQQHINRQLKKKGYQDVRITRQFLGLTSAQNRHTNGFRFVDSQGKLQFHQQAQINDDSFDFSDKFFVGKAHYDRNDSLIEAPFNFTEQNYLSLLSLQQMLQNVLFPGSVRGVEPFELQKEDYQFLYRYLSQYPSETPYPKYDTSLFYDSYVKFFFRDSTRRMPDHVRVFNKVGWSYGFLTDVSYVADFSSKIEYMLAATVYVNSDEVLNDDRYEYDSIGHPFLYQLGQTMYRYESQRKRVNKPDLSRFAITYERRPAGDNRPSLKEVDN